MHFSHFESALTKGKSIYGNCSYEINNSTFDLPRMKGNSLSKRRVFDKMLNPNPEKG